MFQTQFDFYIIPLDRILEYGSDELKKHQPNISHVILLLFDICESLRLPILRIFSPILI